ncbi:MAG: 2-amino-4-hydroxy-6-hydroxymethyldihydropteridine diphosphokinase [Candidatus Kapabacteria bacterium]|nr:2-amino-4-hydroxy-6-hydroxymethyldihydropteridine diphosphokinase [Candidatus Kapabacteria bacterium]
MSSAATPVVLALGANLGDRIAMMHRAVARLADAGVEHMVCSPMYETEPVGYTEQPAFVNMAVAGQTSLTPHQLASACRSIEQALGRTPRAKWHEREIDIDIVLYGHHVVHDDALDIPHPRMQDRRFVLQPCADIVPDMMHPLLQRRVNELLTACSDTAGVRRIEGIGGS